MGIVLNPGTGVTVYKLIFFVCFTLNPLVVKEDVNILSMICFFELTGLKVINLDLEYLDEVLVVFVLGLLKMQIFITQHHV
jgi:hypothetical protein